MDKYEAEHILELSGTYDAGALKAAYRRLAAVHHPDAARMRDDDEAAATAKMQQINEAHGYLSRLLAPAGTLRCDDAPGRYGAAAGWPGGTANPFDGSRPGRERWRGGGTTHDYYAADPGNRAAAESARRRAQAARENPYRRAWEEASAVPQDAARPNPRWFAPLWRAIARFPYRVVFLFAACLFAGLTDPLHLGNTMGAISFEQALMGLALLNLVFPIVTDPLRWLLLWLLDRARSLCWKLQGKAGG